MKLAELVEVSRRIGATRSRREKTARLAALLQELPPGERGAGLSWMAGRVAQGRIGVGPAAVREASTAEPAAFPSLEVREVDRRLAQIAALSGPGSGRERVGQLGRLFAAATAPEQRFLARLVLGELRQGALEGVLAEAVARATGLPAADVRRAAMLAGDPVEVGRAALEQGAEGLARYRLALFRPVQPMLARPAASLADALARAGDAALEAKLDGARIQVHRLGEDVRVFSRQLRDVTAAVPEVVERVLAAPARELVLDGELLALRPDGRPRPFQETMRRFGRRLDVAQLRDEIPLTPFFFDLLHCDGDTLLDRPAADRQARLDALALGAVARVETADPAVAEAFLAGVLAAGHEGVMVKSLASPYEAGRRGSAWWKVKPAHTLDLVVLAAEWGSGRRRGWLSNLHLGARDPATGGFAMLGKTFKGLSDEMLAWQTQHLEGLAVAQEGAVVRVRPELVVEVSFDGVQQSPQYPAGLALRFARVVRHRPDKRAAEADTVSAVKALHDAARA